MKTITEERPLPPEHMRVTVTLGDRGDHVIVQPATGTGKLIIGAYHADKGAPREAASKKFAAGYAIGLCWAHQWAELGAVPSWNADVDQMHRDGATVLKELQRAGYTHKEVQALSDGVMNAVFGMYNEEDEAAALADFTVAPKGEEVFETSTSASLSSEPPAGSDSSAERAAWWLKRGPSSGATRANRCPRCGP